MPNEPLQSSPQSPDPDTLRRAAAMLRDAENIACLTGAGISAESGLATFRGAASDTDADDPDAPLWSRYDPMELAHIDAFNRDPELVTRWYHWRFNRCKDAEPNRGHAALAELEARFRREGKTFTLITQNIDGLHQKAGSQDPVEIHGTILTWRCLKTGAHCPIEEVPFDTFPPRSDEGGVLRPSVVWFGESLPPEAVRLSQIAVESCDLFMSVGTSAAVYPAAGFIELAVARGAHTIEVNLEPTALSSEVDAAIHAPCGTALPALLDEAFGPSGSGPGQ